MIRNYFKIAWRSLRQHKVYSFINIAGLSIGLAACLIVATVVVDELSYDRQWKKGDDIYRVLSVSTGVKGEQFMPVAFAGLGPSLKRDLPEVEDYCRMSVSKVRLQLGNNKEGISFKNLLAEESIWNMLDFKVIAGQPQKYIKGYVNLVITQKFKEQYFPGENPIGKIIMTVPDYGKPNPYLITGIVRDIPQNTHLRADFITLGQFSAEDNRLPQTGEGYSFVPQYILLKHGIAIGPFTNKVNKWIAQQAAGNDNLHYSFQFQPMKNVYLRSDFNGVQAVHGSIRNVYIFAGVALLLLLIACINFVNLTISRVFNRARETGIRKVLGAQKLQLIARFLSESLLFFIISFVIAFLFYPLFLKPVEAFLEHPLVLNLYNAAFLAIVVCCIFFVSLVTGLYPAWFLSRPQPIVILRNKNASNLQLSLLKKALVVGQFVISAAIIIAALLVNSQLNFMSRKNLGFNKNNLLNISWTDWGVKAADFKQSVLKIPGVENASITEWHPTGGSGTMSREVTVPGQKEKLTAYFIEADADLPATLGLQLKSGRSFNPQLATDAMDADSSMFGSSAATKTQQKLRPYLATDYTAKLFTLGLNRQAENIPGTLAGVLEDFNSESLHNKLQPTFIEAVNNLKHGDMLIRIKPGYEKQALSALNTIYKNFYPEKPFNYNWIDDQVNDQYKAEYKLQRLFTGFSMLIIFLACMGLFGLVSFTAEQRIKEIGVRKVLGATVSHIVMLITKDFIGLVIIAIAIASPVAWYAMYKWLQDFAYRINIQWWVFAVTGLATILIAFITISLQAIKAATANPVKSLRSE